jgi:hypothetical protein
MNAFSNKLLAMEGGDLRFVTAREDGRRAWYLLRLNPLHYVAYKSGLRTETMTLTDYAEILCSGWGRLSQMEISRLKASHADMA